MTWNITLLMRIWRVIRDFSSEKFRFTPVFAQQQADVSKSVNSLNRNQLRIHLQFRYCRHEHTLQILRGSSFENG